MNSEFHKGQFGYDLKFLREYIHPVILSNKNEKQQLVIAPEFQSRIMCSTANGLHSKSFGWINYDLIASRKKQEHINAYGGEDRLWLGPEAGQFGLFFVPGKSFDFENYYVPNALDKEAFQLINQTESTATFQRETSLVNYSNTRFNVSIERKISLLSDEEINASLHIGLNDGINTVGFKSENKLINTGNAVWKKNTGLLSIWILGIQKATDETVAIIPVSSAKVKINSDYFSELKNDRLQIQNNCIFFKADGKYRSKIGIRPSNAKNILGSFDSENEVLTIVKFSLSGSDCYVNSLWKLQDNPYSGDVINSYNDGAISENEKQLGSFYELETSSPAAELKPGEFIFHTHSTYHFQAKTDLLNSLAEKLLGTSLFSPFI